MSLTFSTVIATRNRSDVLAVSLPLHLQQSRLPEKIVVVDSSDDMSANRALVARLNEDGLAPITHIASVAGSSLQRNIGMDQVDSDVIFFPDDDSILYPETLHHMMRIYERDTDRHIGGVTTSVATQPPAGVFDSQNYVERKMHASLFRRCAHSTCSMLEKRIFPNGLALASARLQAALPPLDSWLDAENAIPVEWITGFRMSFRVESIGRVRFNESLGRYAMYEDIDACLQIIKNGQHLIAARNAHIYHHVYPGKRTAARKFGAARILNSVYTIMRSGTVDSSIIPLIRRHEWFKMQIFRADRKGTYGTEQYLGARDAYRALPELLASPPNKLDETYLVLRKRCGLTDD